MRLLTLDLERYGPFTGRRLSFPPDARLHVVYGPNEAGKSSSLAAITDLLFGIESRTTYDFRHEGKDLRIGAEIVGRDGRRLAFRRRKGNKNTLLDAGDAPLADDILAPLLGGLSRPVFCHAFGLNTAGLRQGAEEMLKSDGEVGTSLFAAASGLRGLTELRQTLDGEADGIFAKHASQNRLFYQALNRYEAARKAIRELEVRAGDWRALNERIDQLGTALDGMKAERASLAAEQARLQRLKRVAPLLRQIDAEIAGLAALGDLPAVPAGFGERLGLGIEALAKAREASAAAAADQTQAKGDLAAITVDRRLLADEAEIEQLFGETAAYANDRRDLPRVQAEADEYAALLGQLAARLGLAGAPEVVDRRPSDAAMALVHSLAAEGRTNEQALDGHRRGLAAEAAALARIERQRAERGVLVDPRPLREKLAALKPALAQIDRRAESERTLAAETRSLAEAAARLAPPVADLDGLARTPLPSAETIGRFRRTLDELADGIRRAGDQVDTAAKALAASQARLAELASGRPIASAEAIADCRRRRDEAWQGLRRRLSGAPEAASGPALTEAILAFERLSGDADRLADAAVTDAERIAAYGGERRRGEEEQARLSDARARRQELEDAQRRCLDEWGQAWAPVVPASPTEMAVWLSQVQALLERRERRERLRADIEALDAGLAAIRPALATLQAEMGLPPLDGLDAALVVRRLDDRLAALAAAWDEARDVETAGREAVSRQHQAAEAEAAVLRAIEAWRSRWRDALAPLGLPPATSADQADAALAAWKDVPRVLHERDNRARRVAGMRRNMADFEGRADRLVQALASDLAALPPELSAKALNDRLTTARNAAARHEQTERRLVEATARRERADATLATAEATLADLAETLPAGCSLPDMLAALTRREQIETSLADRRRQLIAQGDGWAEDRLRAELADFDADQAEASLKRLTAEDGRLDREAQEVYAERDREMRRRGQMEQGMGAEVALQQRRNAEAELAAAARRWTVVKLAAALVGRVVERHRASRQDPLMARAGQLFALLTGGLFAGLDQSFDEDDTPRLVGRRATGETVPLPGLSEGTRDQLYLALRLAYLEDYAARAETAPFVGDDLFTSFDEARTANGLKALAAIGGEVQPILFTHHRHVADLARATLGDEAAIIELG